MFQIGGKPKAVFCDMEDDNGGWTVFQRRQPSCDPDLFNKNWTDYKGGFGDLNSEFWLGLDALHHLTTDEGESMDLKLTFTDFDGGETVLMAKNFQVGNETDLYSLSMTNATRNGEVVPHGVNVRNIKFSTPDSDNDAS